MSDAKVGRGSLLDPVVRGEITAASPERRRRIAVAVAAMALQSLASRPPELDSALSEIQSGVLNRATRELVAQVAEHLDDRYLDMFDDEIPSGRTEGWEEVFSSARAAAALGFAFDDDATVAATEAAYEALHALDGDEAVLRSTVLGTR
jgi:hypothetical protein